jgi:hypothetical protein
MDLYAGLHGKFGKPELQVQPPMSFYEGPEAKVDEDLVALWKSDGWARYRGGLFWTVDPRRFIELPTEWPIVPKDALVFGRDAFGNIYMVNKPNVNRLDIQWNSLGNLGPSAYVFLNATMVQPRYREQTLNAKLFEAVRKSAGDLEADECYGLFPALPLGGSEEDPSSYRRVKLREYLALVAQAH